MHELLAGLVPGLPLPAARSIIARADGIPLYAVETVRMLVSDGRLREADGHYEPVGDLGELAVPETLQALIAARLDGLDPADRTLLQDAAVLGHSFTLEGLAAVSGEEPVRLQARLRDLAKSELITQEIDPRSPERGMYGFVQALIREVAYGTLAKRDRRSRHLAAARFFESLGEDELAGALAGHYIAAWQSAPDGPEGDAVAVQARLALVGAADRALNLGSPESAVGFLEQALLVTADPSERAPILERAGRAASNAVQTDAAEAFLREAIAIRREMGDTTAVFQSTASLAAALITGRRLEDAGVAARARRGGSRGRRGRLRSRRPPERSRPRAVQPGPGRRRPRAGRPRPPHRRARGAERAPDRHARDQGQPALQGASSTRGHGARRGGATARGRIRPAGLGGASSGRRSVSISRSAIPVRPWSSNDRRSPSPDGSGAATWSCC